MNVLSAARTWFAMPAGVLFGEAATVAAQLTAKQRTFALEYIICKNGTEAARRAGYAGDDATLAVTASRLLRNAKVVAFINERFAEMAMRADEVIARMSEQAAADMGDFIDVKHNWMSINLERAKQNNKLHLIKKIKQGKYGVELELYDAQAAQRTLAQHHGLLKSEVNININVELVVKAVRALEDAGIDAQEFFEKAIARAERQRLAHSGQPA
jgi:phage terminase small subunit